LFKHYRNKKNKSGYVQNYKIYECEDCIDCPLKSLCTKAKGNRQVHWNTIFEEIKAKVRTALACDKNNEIYFQRKIEVKSVFGHIKGRRSFRKFSLRVLHKAHVEFGIVALAHNILKVADIRRLLSEKMKMASRKRGNFFTTCQFFWTNQTAPVFTHRLLLLGASIRYAHRNRMLGH